MDIRPILRAKVQVIRHQYKQNGIGSINGAEDIPDEDMIAHMAAFIDKKGVEGLLLKVVSEGANEFGHYTDNLYINTMIAHAKANPTFANILTELTTNTLTSINAKTFQSHINPERKEISKGALGGITSMTQTPLLDTKNIGSSLYRALTRGISTNDPAVNKLKQYINKHPKVLGDKTSLTELGIQQISKENKTPINKVWETAYHQAPTSGYVDEKKMEFTLNRAQQELAQVVDAHLKNNHNFVNPLLAVPSSQGESKAPVRSMSMAASQEYHEGSSGLSFG